MIRWLLIVFAASLAVSVGCFAAAASLGGLGSHIAISRFTGPQITRDLAWQGSEELRISVPADIVYVQGPATKFTVTGPQDEINGLTFTDGHLALRDEGLGAFWFLGSGRRQDPRLTVSVTGPSTRRFFLSGAQKLDIERYDQDGLDLHISGVADVKASGRARHADMRISGTGNLDLAQLAMDDATVKISGAGNATLAPKLAADVSISGVGRVNLLTRPASLHTHISGAGSITQP